jgi:chorismate mutase
MTKPESADRDPRLELIDCRNAIEVIDRRIVTLLAQRIALGLRAAAAKRSADLPLKDKKREAEVIERAVAEGRSHKLSEKAVKKIFEHIVDMSRRAQEDAR